MDIEILVPQVRTVPLAEVVSQLTAPAAKRLPFSGEMVEFCTRFSQAIFRDSEASRYPELTALAFWMRKAEIVRLHDQFRRIGGPETVVVPRGLVFHIPPANVDTIFVYSWLLSALTGNRNVIRMSSRRAPQSEILLRLWRETAAQASEDVARNTLVISYGHDDEATRALSQACDVRVIWGGDHSISTIRAFPLVPHARELTFPDRASLAVIHAARYAELDEAGRSTLADQFFNDAYWFDQMACSSPRMVIWCGESDQVGGSSRVFWKALSASIERKQFQASAAVHMRKLVFACEAILDMPIAEYRREGEATILEFGSLAAPPPEHCGGGLFFAARVDRLVDLAAVLQRRHQTMTYFGFTREELHGLARELAGTSLDRIVPFGQALSFSRFWDGYDLLQEFCRVVYCTASE